MMKALIAFAGVIDGREVRFAAGQDISAAHAKELGLADKPDLAATIKSAKGAPVETEKP